MTLFEIIADSRNAQSVSFYYPAANVAGALEQFNRDFPEWTVYGDAAPAKCNNEGESCRGEVAILDLGSRSTPRPWCTYHRDKRIEVEERMREYDSPTPPDWFDPAYAGERWDDDY